MQKQQSIEEQTKQKEETFNKIVHYLQSKGVKYQILEHAKARTSQESSSVRCTPLEWGSKTMLVTGKETNFLLLYRANRKISWSKLRKVVPLGKKSRMCKEQEVIQLGILPGAVPPFSKLLGIAGIVDSRFKELKEMAFNAGLQGKSIVMNTCDFPFQEMLQFDITE